MLYPVRNLDTGELFMSVYLGMGGGDYWPLSRFNPIIRDTIAELFLTGELEPDGESFVSYQYGTLYQRLKPNFATPF